MILRVWDVGPPGAGAGPHVASIVQEKRPAALVQASTRIGSFPMWNAVLDTFAGALQQCAVERVHDFRPPGLYAWKQPFFTRGEALLVDLRGHP